jgi:hypothetical protein
MARGEVQIEGGYTVARAAAEKSNTIGELLLRIGLASRAELRIEPGSYTRTRSPSGALSGREDGELGTKLRLHEVPPDLPSPVPAVSVLLLSSVPTGGDRFRQSRPQPEAKLASEWTLTHRLGLAANFDVARPVADARRYTELSASASLGVDLSSRVGAFAEFYGIAPQSGGGEHTRYVDTGITASIAPNVQVDVRVGVGLNGTAHDYFLGAGFARRW